MCIGYKTHCRGAVVKPVRKFGELGNKQFYDNVYKRLEQKTVRSVVHNKTQHITV